MKKLPFLLAALAAVILMGAWPRDARAEVSIDLFYESLSPYGYWVEVEDYGYCWRPSNVEGDWAPYMDGYWAYTDAGWTWVSYEDWGWATYHYGRWAFVDGEGWVWVPGYEWAPAWVSWRYSDDYVGWAPLPPDVEFRREIGISIWVDTHYDIGPGYYNFCEVRRFGSPSLRPVIIDRRRNVTIIQHTVNVTNITVVNNNYIFNGGPRYDVLSRRSERPIERLRLERLRDGDRIREWRGRRENFTRKDGNRLIVAAPDVTRRADAKPERIAKRIEKERIQKGWRRVADESQREEVRRKMRGDRPVARPEDAPARKPTQEDLAPVASLPEQPSGNRERGREGGRGEREARPGDTTEDAQRRRERGAQEQQDRPQQPGTRERQTPQPERSPEGERDNGGRRGQGQATQGQQQQRPSQLQAPQTPAGTPRRQPAEQSPANTGRSRQEREDAGRRNQEQQQRSTPPRNLEGRRPPQRVQPQLKEQPRRPSQQRPDQSQNAERQRRAQQALQQQQNAERQRREQQARQQQEKAERQRRAEQAREQQQNVERQRRAQQQQQENARRQAQQQNRRQQSASGQGGEDENETKRRGRRGRD
jgi:hypothetical protein